MARSKPTQKELLVLYLRGKDVHISDTGLVFASPDITQEGIAEALGIGRKNIPRLIKPLIEEGYVKERKARVNGYTYTKKVYTLTWKGEQLIREIYEKYPAFDEYINAKPKLRLEVKYSPPPSHPS